MKKIIIGTIFTILLLMIMPSIPAVQYKTVMDKIKNVDIDSLEIKLKSINDPKIQEALKLIDLSAAKQKVKEFLSSEHTTPYINVFYLVTFLLTLTYQVILGRPSIVMMYFMLLSLWIVVSNFRTGSQTPVCGSVQAGFIPWIFINLVGLIAYKASSNKLIGLAIMALFYFLSEIVVALALGSEINSTS